MADTKNNMELERIILIIGIVFVVLGVLYSGYVYYYNNHVYEEEEGLFNGTIDLNYKEENKNNLSFELKEFNLPTLPLPSPQTYLTK